MGNKSRDLYEFQYVTTADLADAGLEPNARTKALMEAGVEYTRLRDVVVEAAKLWREDWLLNAKQLREAVDALIDFDKFGRKELLGE